LKGAGAGMEEARAELQNIRAEAFERLAGGAGGAGGAGMNGAATAPPPSYAVVEGGFGGYEAQPGYSVV
jgi:hypothetical protein